MTGRGESRPFSWRDDLREISAGPSAGEEDKERYKPRIRGFTIV